MKNIFYFLLLICCSFNFSDAQSVNQSSSILTSAQLPDTITQLIRNTPKKDLISVIGRMEFSQQVMRVENLVFHNNSELVFNNYDLPYVIIAVKNLKFNAPAVKSSVKFEGFNLNTLKGAKGTSGTGGAPGQGNGVKGGNGSNGDTGTKGGTKHTPDLYLIVENINTDFGDIASFDWQVFTTGIVGGQGGDGGNGGNGGNGSGGRNSRSNVFHCTRGASNGGRGGNGGSGGKGGPGGNGGNAGNIYLVGNTIVTNRLTYVQYKLSGGNSGQGGVPGTSGPGGAGGGGGRGSTHCSGANRGSNGASPATLGSGETGTKGEDGEVRIVKKTVSDLF
jgi:hypothetical protein